MNKEEAIQFFRDACASNNTYKTENGYGPGGYQQMMLNLPESRSDIANLITCGWYGGAPEWKRKVTEHSIRTLHIGSEEFILEPSEAEELRALWGEKGQIAPSAEYARTRF